MITKNSNTQNTPAKAPVKGVGTGELVRRQSITLTIREIIDLAEFAGLRLQGQAEDLDELEHEITVEQCPARGVDDQGVAKHYKHIAYFDEYPEEGVFGLGQESTAALVQTVEAAQKHAHQKPLRLSSPNNPALPRAGNESQPTDKTQSNL